MARRSFTLEVVLRASTREIHGYLSDMDRQVELHPLLIRAIPRGPDPERPNAHRFQMVDRFWLGPFPLRVRYDARIEVISATEIVIDAWAFPRVHLTNRYTLTPQGETTRLVESSVVDAPWWIVRFTARTAKAAHQTVLHNLGDTIEGSEHSRECGGEGQHR